MERAETSVEAYFAAHTPLPMGDLAAIGEALAAVRSHSLSRLKGSRKLRSHSLVAQSYDSSVPRIAAQHKLVSARRDKQVLQDRLAYVQEKIDTLKKDPTGTPGRIRKKMHSHREKSANSNLDTVATDQTSSESKRSDSALSRLSLLRKLQREKEERQRKLQSIEEQRGQRLAAEAEAERKREEELRLRQKSAIIQSLQHRHQIEQQRKEFLQREREESELRLKEVQSRKPLHESLEEKFTAEVVLPELRRQQEVLAKRKAPVVVEEIVKHAEEVRAREEEMERKRQEVRALKQRELSQLAKALKFYRPKAASIVEAEVEQQKNALLQKSESAKQQLMKKQRYDVLVRELFKPKASKLKKLERELRVEKLKVKKAAASNSERPLEHREKPEVPKFPGRKTNRSKSTQSLSEQRSSSTSKKDDYLQVLRSRRRVSAVSSLDRPYESKWQELLSDSTNPERLSAVQKEVQRMESLARSQEQMLNSLDWRDGVSTREAVGSLYVDSIKAKLALLGELS